MSKKIIFTDYTDELLNSYLKDISKYKVLNSSEIAILISKAQNGDERAREKVITSNLRFVVTIAKQFQNRGISLMDLISAGNEGLLISIDKYDVNKGTVFLTYAGWWIKQCIYNTIYAHGDLIRLPISQRLLVIKILDTTNEYVQKYSRNPSAEELSELTGIEVSQINYLSQFSNKILSVDDYIGDGEGNQLCDVIPDNEPLLDDQINKKLVLSNLDKMLDVLPNREHDLIRMYFGIGMNPVDPDYISDMYGVGRERIRQMKESALGKLKKKFSKQLKSFSASDRGP
jgi:RNA polymerase primary sigma factor